VLCTSGCQVLYHESHLPHSLAHRFTIKVGNSLRINRCPVPYNMLRDAAIIDPSSFPAIINITMYKFLALSAIRRLFTIPSVCSRSHCDCRQKGSPLLYFSKPSGSECVSRTLIKKSYRSRGCLLWKASKLLAIKARSWLQVKELLMKSQS
jgi:hypothetical protein